MPPELLALLHGAALGLAVAAPIGPTGLLCVQRTLAGGLAPGLATGYGAATMHSIYALAASAGLSVILGIVGHCGGLLRLAAALFLLRLAYRAIARTPRLDPDTAERVAPARAYATGLAWTLANPVTLVGFATLTPAILGPELLDWGILPLLAGGVLLGSAAWWTVLAVAVASLRSRLGVRGLRLANLATGTGLACFAASLLLDAAGLLWVR